MKNTPAVTVIGIAVVLMFIGLAQRTPRASHEATVDRPTIPMPRSDPRNDGLSYASRTYDGDALERYGGRRWLIMRTGGGWL